MTAASVLRTAYLPHAVDQSTYARARRWFEILVRSRSPRLTYLSALLHASDPVLSALRTGTRMNLVDSEVQVEYRFQRFTLEPHVLPAIDLFTEMIEAGYGLHLDGEDWRIDVPHGPSFLVDRATLVSDLAVIGLRFLKREYGFFDVRDHVVLDIGANIGDSALYFALHGARHVVGYEPFAATFARAQANVAVNDLCNRIELFHCGIAGRTDWRTVGYDGRIAAGLSTAHADNSLKSAAYVDSISLIPFSEAVESTLSKAAGPLACKMDCEGSEFEIFDEDPGILDALKRIDRMLIEYHWKNPQPILERLQDAGFDVDMLPLQPGVGLILGLRPTNATPND